MQIWQLMLHFLICMVISAGCTDQRNSANFSSIFLKETKYKIEKNLFLKWTLHIGRKSLCGHHADVVGDSTKGSWTLR